MVDQICKVDFTSSFNEAKAIRNYYSEVFHLFATNNARCFLVPEGNPFFTYKWASEVTEFTSIIPHSEILNEVFTWAGNEGIVASFKRIVDFEEQTFFVLELS